MMSDEPTLTRRELEILSLLAEGLSNDEIAARLVISPNTVKVHLRNIFDKMGVQSRTEATMEAVRRGWIAVPGRQPAVAPPAPAPAPLPAWPPPASSWQSWQGWLLLVAALLLSLLAVWPAPMPVTPSSAPTADFTTDLTTLRLGVAPRQETPRWTTRASLSIPRSRAAAAVIDGRLYVVGGEAGMGDLDDHQVYDPIGDVWQRLPPRPVAARGAAAAAWEDRLYVAGGCTGNAVLTRMDRFDPASRTWTTMAPLPAPRCALALVSYGRWLYAVGGWDGRNATATVFVYDPEGDTWENGPALPEPRADLAAVVLRDRLFVLGGYDGERQRAEMWVFDPATGRWDKAPPLPEPRAGLAVAAEGISIYVIGGGLGNQAGLHERYDLITQAWSTLDTPRRGPWHHSVAAIIGPNLHIVGGWTGDYSAAHEAYQASHLLFLPFGAQGAQGAR
jgi:DNA-binding CsgD family transcriptional regulator